MASIPPPAKCQKRQSPRTWDELYKALVVYKEENGDCEVPAKYKDSGLSWWIARQRRHRDQLTSDQRAKLEAIGFDLHTISERWERTWDEKFERLVEFRSEYLHCNVPQTSFFDERLAKWSNELGRWVSEQRKSHRLGNLSRERQMKLESI
jgi:hypothetical protein